MILEINITVRQDPCFYMMWVERKQYLFEAIRSAILTEYKLHAQINWIVLILQKQWKMKSQCQRSLQKSESVAVRNVSEFRIFSCIFFPVFGVNTEIYSVNLRLQWKYGKMWTRKTAHLDTFNFQCLLRD